MRIALTVATPVFHAATDVVRYTGGPTDFIVTGQPILDVQGNLQHDKDNNLIVYTAVQTTKTWVERFFYDPSTGAISGSPQTITLATAPINPATLSVVIDGRVLAASEFLLTGRTLVVTPVAGTRVGASLKVTYAGHQLHGRGDTVYVETTPGAGDWHPALHAATDPVLALGNEALLWRGGEQSYSSIADTVQDATPVSHVSIRGTDGMPGDVVSIGVAVEITLGSGADHVTVMETLATTTSIDTAGGIDTVAVRSISGDTTVSTGDGADTVAVGSWAGFWPGGFQNAPGVANGFHAHLHVDGQGPTAGDTLDVEDSADAAPNTGVLSSTALIGIFGAGGSLGYGGFEHLTIRLGEAGNSFAVQSTHGTASVVADTTVWVGNGSNSVYVQSIAGPTTVTTGTGSDVFRIGSDAPAVDPIANSILDGIQNAWLTLQAGTGADELHTYDSGQTIHNEGVLTSADLTGLGMTLGIRYTGFESLDLRLGHVRLHFGDIRNAPVKRLRREDDLTQHPPVNIDGGNRTVGRVASVNLNVLVEPPRDTI